MPMPKITGRVSPDAIRDFFARTNPPSPEAMAWRAGCYEAGRELVAYVEQHYFPVEGKDVIDVAAGWGGHILAFAERGARTIAADLNDHLFAGLASFAEQESLSLRTQLANCENLPFPDESFDVVLGLELVEHIESVPAFAGEVARLLKPRGVAIISTPARFKSFFDGEPHYHLRYLTALPFPLQKVVAQQVFRRTYPFPITRQYLFASSALRPFRKHGLQGTIRWTGRLAEHFGATPVVGILGRELMFNFLIVTRADTATLA